MTVVKMPGSLPRLPRPGFPYTAPTVPDTVDALPIKARLGAAYETEWARRFPARLARVLLLEGVMRPAVAALGAPERAGIDRHAGQSDGAVIIAPNHPSPHDTPP
ncbi:MAG: hypothetical protein ABWZ52_07375, partial [Acidimicrobiales bacterium]